jgi:hypothetical protein
MVWIAWQVSVFCSFLESDDSRCKKRQAMMVCAITGAPNDTFSRPPNTVHLSLLASGLMPGGGPHENGGLGVKMREKAELGEAGDSTILSLRFGTRERHDNSMNGILSKQDECWILSARAEYGQNGPMILGETAPLGGWIWVWLKPLALTA